MSLAEERLRFEAAMSLAGMAYPVYQKVFNGSEKVKNVMLAAQILLQARVLLGDVGEETEKALSAAGEFDELLLAVRDWQERISKLQVRETHEHCQVIEVNFR